MRGNVLRWGLSVLTMVSVATAVLLVTGWGSAMAASVSSVFVTNTSSNPVPVNGSVNVGNFPSTQPVSGSVNVGNTTTNPVNVSVGNFPSTQAVSGSVNVGNTSTNPVPVSGSVNVGNLPTDGSGNIKVHEQGTANVNVTNSSLPVVPGSPSGAFEYAGTNHQTFDCPAQPNKVGTQWFITSVSVMNNGSSMEQGGVSLANPQDFPDLLIFDVPAGSTQQLTFPQPWVLTSHVAGDCLEITAGADEVVWFNGYR